MKVIIRLIENENNLYLKPYLINEANLLLNRKNLYPVPFQWYDRAKRMITSLELLKQILLSERC